MQKVWYFRQFLQGTKICHNIGPYKKSCPPKKLIKHHFNSQFTIIKSCEDVTEHSAEHSGHKNTEA